MRKSIVLMATALGLGCGGAHADSAKAAIMERDRTFCAVRVENQSTADIDVYYYIGDSKGEDIKYASFVISWGQGFDFAPAGFIKSDGICSFRYDISEIEHTLDFEYVDTERRNKYACNKITFEGTIFDISVEHSVDLKCQEK